MVKGRRNDVLVGCGKAINNKDRQKLKRRLNENSYGRFRARAEEGIVTWTFRT
jgi:hypothetical protein